MRRMWCTDDKEKDDKLSTVIQMMSEVMNKLMEVELELSRRWKITWLKSWSRELKFWKEK